MFFLYKNGQVIGVYDNMDKIRGELSVFVKDGVEGTYCVVEGQLNQTVGDVSNPLMTYTYLPKSGSEKSEKSEEKSGEKSEEKSDDESASEEKHNKKSSLKKVKTDENENESEEKSEHKKSKRSSSKKSRSRSKRQDSDSE
jgi:Mg-chelatase subunit ChlI